LYDVLTDNTSGMIVAMATSDEEALQLVLKDCVQSEFNEASASDSEL